MNKVYDIILQTGKEDAIETGYVFCQGDSGQTLNLIVKDFDITGTTASIIFRKNDGNVVQADISGSNGSYSYVMRGTELQAVGKVIADIKFRESNNKRISSASFVFNVTADTINSTAIESGTYSDAIDRAVDRVNEAAEAAEGIVLGAVPKATENILGGVKSGGDVTVGTDSKMKVSNIDDTLINFTEATAEAELVTGSKLSVLIGLIKKKFNTVNNNLTTTNTNLAKLKIVTVTPTDALPYVDIPVTDAVLGKPIIAQRIVNVSSTISLFVTGSYIVANGTVRILLSSNTGAGNVLTFSIWY